MFRECVQRECPVVSLSWEAGMNEFSGGNILFSQRKQRTKKTRQRRDREMLSIFLGCRVPEREKKYGQEEGITYTALTNATCLDVVVSSPTDKRSEFFSASLFFTKLLLLYYYSFCHPSSLDTFIFSWQDNQLTITRILCRVSHFHSALHLLVCQTESEGWSKKWKGVSESDRITHLEWRRFHSRVLYTKSRWRLCNTSSFSTTPLKARLEMRTSKVEDPKMPSFLGLKENENTFSEGLEPIIDINYRQQRLNSLWRPKNDTCHAEDHLVSSWEVVWKLCVFRKKKYARTKNFLWLFESRSCDSNSQRLRKIFQEKHEKRRDDESWLKTLDRTWLWLHKHSFWHYYARGSEKIFFCYVNLREISITSKIPKYIMLACVLAFCCLTLENTASYDILE